MTFRLGTTSLRRLEGVHPDLVNVIELAITSTPIDFMVLEGLRSKKRQEQLVAEGRSKTMNSRHLTGDAVDIAPLVGGEIPWNNKALFDELSKHVFAAADKLGVLVQWGGNFDGFYDGPHWQLVWPNGREKAKALRAAREAAETAPETERGTHLSPDITPGLAPEDMRDEDFDPGWPSDLEGPK